MNCPSCSHPLTEQSAAGIAAHICIGGCGSLWLEILQVRRLAERLPGQGQSFLFADRAGGVRLFRNPEHPCPRCETTLLYRHCFSRRQELEIDQCSKCGGLWIDPGHLAGLGDASITSGNKKELAREFFVELFDNKVRRMNFVNDDMLEAARQIVYVFRFLTPEDYFPETLPLELK